jgi:hypothetical protein
MSGSFKKIDYSLRPAKYAERRMIRDIFRRLAAFEPPENYTYIGFGSVWFADFILFHRGLGVRKMISIESSIGAAQRVRDNAPFRIDLRFEKSTKVLPKLRWRERSFVWLDYDDPLTPDMLSDVRTVARRARSGSVIAVTVRCSKAREVEEAEADEDDEKLPALERFRNKFKASKIPSGIAEDDLTGWPYADLIRAMIAGEVDDALSVRNMRLRDRVKFQPICSFNYADGAWMTTFVGILYKDSEYDLVGDCQFDTLDFIESATGPVQVKIPKLTVREMRQLEEQLPLKGRKIRLGSIPQKHSDLFCKVYRYLPNFAVLEN